MIAAVLFVLQVGVRAPRSGATRSCGSSWDVVAGRTGWQQWWTQDLADNPAGSAGSLVRTVECPAAVNQRTLVAGTLAGAGVVTVATGELAGRRHQERRRDRRPRRLRRVGAVLIGTGCLLTIAGLVGIALLVANPGAALFVYVSRPVVVLAGTVLLVPAVFIAALGWTVRAAADYVEEGRGGDADQ